MRLNPTAEVVSRQYIAYEQALGAHFRREFDFNVVGGAGWYCDLTGAKAGHQNQLAKEADQFDNRTETQTSQIPDTTNETLQ